MRIFCCWTLKVWYQNKAAAHLLFYYQKTTVKKLKNSGTANGFTPLMACALRNEIHMARALLQNGADKTVKDSKGRNALWFAVLFDKTEFVHFLLGKCLILLKWYFPFSSRSTETSRFSTSANFSSSSIARWFSRLFKVNWFKVWIAQFRIWFTWFGPQAPSTAGIAFKLRTRSWNFRLSSKSSVSIMLAIILTQSFQISTKISTKSDFFSTSAFVSSLACSSSCRSLASSWQRFAPFTQHKSLM